MGKTNTKRATQLRVALFVFILSFMDRSIMFGSVGDIRLHPVPVDED